MTDSAPTRVTGRFVLTNTPHRRVELVLSELDAAFTVTTTPAGGKPHANVLTLDWADAELAARLITDHRKGPQ